MAVRCAVAKVSFTRGSITFSFSRLKLLEMFTGMIKHTLQWLITALRNKYERYLNMYSGVVKQCFFIIAERVINDNVIMNT